MNGFINKLHTSIGQIYPSSPTFWIQIVRKHETHKITSFLKQLVVSMVYVQVSLHDLTIVKAVFKQIFKREPLSIGYEFVKGNWWASENTNSH